MANGMPTRPKGFPKSAEPTQEHTYTTTIGVFPGGDPIILTNYPGGKTVKQLLIEKGYSGEFTGREVKVQINGKEASLDSKVNPGDKVVVVGTLKGA